MKSTGGIINGNLPINEFLYVLHKIVDFILPEGLNSHNIPLIDALGNDLLQGNFIGRKETVLLISSNTYCKIAYWHGQNNLCKPTIFGYISILSNNGKICQTTLCRLNQILIKPIKNIPLR